MKDGAGENLLKGRWLGHPLHPIVVHVPLAMWPAALLFDLLSQFEFGGNVLVRLSFYAILFGLAAAMIAIPTGLMDWSEIKKEKPAWRIGVYHMTLNFLVTALFAVNLGMRWSTFRLASTVPAVPLILSLAGVTLLLISAYLGGRMIYDHGISVARFSKERWRHLAEASGANVPPPKGR